MARICRVRASAIRRPPSPPVLRAVRCDRDKNGSVSKIEFFTAVQRQPEVAINWQMREILNYLKGRLAYGRVFTVPRDLFEAARDGVLDAAPTFESSEFARLVAPREPGALPGIDVEFCQVVDARPESKKQIRVPGVAKVVSKIIVKRCQPGRWDAANVVELQLDDSAGVALDLANWCSLERFERLLTSLFAWETRPADFTVQAL